MSIVVIALIAAKLDAQGSLPREVTFEQQYEVKGTRNTKDGKNFLRMW